MNSETATPSLGLARQSLPLKLLAVHDESGMYRTDRHFVTGFVFVDERHPGSLLAGMRAARERFDYWRELHYCRIKCIGTAKAKTAAVWFDELDLAMGAGLAKAYVLAVDTRVPSFDHDRFRGRPHRAYNRFTRMALEVGIRWLYGTDSRLSLRVLSDGKSRRPGGDDEDPASGDNFCSYLPLMTRRRAIAEREWPSVVFSPGLVEEVRPGAHHIECGPECELVQLSDLVVSSAGAAIRGPSRQAGRRELARRAGAWIRAGEGSNWDRPSDRFRTFRGGLFLPGAEDAWPKRLPLKVDLCAGPGQEALFSLADLPAEDRVGTPPPPT